MADHDHTAQNTAWRALTGHTWWQYRSCAPAPGRPDRSRRDPAVPLTVWQTPDTETQPQRAAREQQATALCHRCPLREQCLTYALGTAEDGPYERWDIWGGMTARDRAHLVAARARTTLRAQAVETTTGLDLTVLRALAAHRAPAAVAAAAQLTLTRTNWHRARLVTALGLDPRATTRMQLLYAARLTGLLDPRTPLLTDRRTLAAVPSRQAAVLRARGIQLPLPGMTTITASHAPSPGPAAADGQPYSLHLVANAPATTRHTALAAAA